MRRGNLAAHSRKLEAANRKRDEHAPVAEMATNDLWASMYRLQSRRNPALRERIHELEAERQRRRAVQA